MSLSSFPSIESKTHAAGVHYYSLSFKKKILLLYPQHLSRGVQYLMKKINK